jgi:LemA protein
MALVIVLVVVILIVGFVLMGMYNRLVRLRNRIENAWSQIDV